MVNVILDTSGIIYSYTFDYEKIVTVHDVLNEVKDKISTAKLASLNINVVEPNKESIDNIRHVAKETGDLEKLSQTDIKLLAVAVETGYTIVSDDKNIQNVAEKLKLRYIPVLFKKIKELIIWRKLCKNCRKFFSINMKECPVCGSELKRVPIEKQALKDL